MNNLKATVINSTKHAVGTYRTRVFHCVYLFHIQTGSVWRRCL